MVSMEAEKEIIQTAMDTMMAYENVTTVTPSTVWTDTWLNNPAGPGASPLYPTYLREPNTTYSYCWTSGGKITRQDESSATCAPRTDSSATIPR